MKKSLRCLETLSQLHRTDWLGGEGIAIYLVKRIFLKSDRTKNKFILELTRQIVPLDNMKRFFDEPIELFDGVCLIIKSPTESHKGVVIIKYSYYFALMFKFFDMDLFSRRYHIVLEPSWAGTCDPGILCYTSLSEPVFVMAYENRDFKFLESINTNLVPVKLSSNWWVNHAFFKHIPEDVKDIDIIIVSGWARFKRHHEIFKALNKVKKVLPDLKVTLVGYPHDLTLDNIKEIAVLYNLSENITFYEWIPPLEVSRLYAKAKVNLLWSRFEGLNRSIIEGMFCNISCIMREGFNYGQKYSYINQFTGCWSSEEKLASNLIHAIKHQDKFSPRQYVMEHHTCFKATEILQEAINRTLLDSPNKFIFEFAVKTNELHGMAYFDDTNEKRFEADIENIKQYLIV
jgi:glycosyltransferase involved in cell wall biosynthesis